MINIDIKILVVKVFATLAILGLIGLASYYYWFVPITVELIEVAQLHTERELSGTWWSTASNSIARDYDLELPQVNFNKYDLLLSGGREVSKLTYTRKSTFDLPYRKTMYIGTAMLKKELHPHTIFVYKFRRAPIIYDDITWPEVEIED